MILLYLNKRNVPENHCKMSLNRKDMGLIALTVSVGAPVYLCIHVSWAVVHSSLLNVCKCDLKKTHISLL